MKIIYFYLSSYQSCVIKSFLTCKNQYLVNKPTKWTLFSPLSLLKVIISLVYLAGAGTCKAKTIWPSQTRYFCHLYSTKHNLHCLACYTSEECHWGCKAVCGIHINIYKSLFTRPGLVGVHVIYTDRKTNSERYLLLKWSLSGDFCCDATA